MSSTKKKAFSVIGQIEGHEFGKRGKVSSIYLLTSTGKQRIKLTKSSRSDLMQNVEGETIPQGLWVEVIAQQKIDANGTLKIPKAKGLKVIEQPPELNTLSGHEPSIKPAENKTVSSQPKERSASSKILICQKSSCRKRGSAALQKAFEQALRDRQLSEQVCVKSTGCLKYCSKGPNVVINKKSYRGVSPSDLPELLDQHFPVCPAAMI